jgi:hypothetical protein
LKFKQNLEHNIINKFTVDFSNYNDLENQTEYNYREIYETYIIAKEFSFYDSNDIPNFCNSFYKDPIDSNIKEYIYLNYILPNLKFKINNNILSDDTIVIHIRSGDIIRDDGYPYCQPPLIAYDNLVEKFNKVIVVTEPDFRNPAISYLINKYGTKIEIRSNSLEDDINLICSAKHFACNSIFNGTFGYTLAWLSKNKTNLYFFEYEMRDYKNIYLFKNVSIEIIYCKDYSINYKISKIIDYNDENIRDIYNSRWKVETFFKLTIAKRGL